MGYHVDLLYFSFSARLRQYIYIYTYDCDASRLLYFLNSVDLIYVFPTYARVVAATRDLSEFARLLGQNENEQAQD